MNDRAGAVVQMPIHESLIRALKDFAAAERVTLQAVCLAAFEMVLAMDSATEEVAAGVAVNVRPPEGFDEVIGFFVNILPIRAIVSGAAALSRFLAANLQPVAGGARASGISVSSTSTGVD